MRYGDENVGKMTLRGGENSGEEGEELENVRGRRWGE